MSTKQKQTVTTTTTTRGRRPRNRKRQANKPRAVVQPTSAVHIAPCTRLYAQALTNPFGVQGLPCIPDNIVIPSHKFSTKSRGVFSTGTNGFGFIVIDPFQMLFNNGSYAVPAPDNFVMGTPILYTDKTYTQTFMQLFDTTVDSIMPGVNGANSNSLFSYQNFDVTGVDNAIRNRQFRLVGCGLRINYIGSNLYNAGRLIIWRNQGCNGLLPEQVYLKDDFLKDNYTSITTVNRSSKYVYYVPDDPRFIAYNDLNEFSPNLIDPDTNQRPRSHHSMGIMIDGGQTDPNQQSWEFEAVAYFEVIGPGFTLSKSHGDPVGHDIVMSSLPNTAPTSAPQQVENSVLSQFLRGFNETTREVAYNVGRRALGYATSAAVSYYNGSTRQLSLMPS